MMMDMKVYGFARVEAHFPDPDVIVLEDDAVADRAERDAALGRLLHSIAIRHLLHPNWLWRSTRLNPPPPRLH